MKTKSGILGVVAIAALVGSTVLTSGASIASTPSSPAERAATAELNRNIIARNAAADDHYRLLEAQYQEQKRLNEARQQQYQTQQPTYRDNEDR